MRMAQNRFKVLTGTCVLWKRVQLWQPARAEQPAWLSVPLFVLFGTLVLISSVLAQGRPDIVWMRGGHAAGVLSVVFSPDGSLIALGSGDGTIKLWRVSDGEEVRLLFSSRGRGCGGWAGSIDVLAHLEHPLDKRPSNGVY